MKNAPMPLGAPSLWPLTLTKSKGTVLAFTSTLPKACTASVWNTPPAAFVSAASSSMGCTTPVSLLIHITDTNAVSPLVILARASAMSTLPSRCTLIIRSSAPSLAA